MKKIIAGTLVFICLLSLLGFSQKNSLALLKKNSIFQYSTLSALLEGVYDGELTVGELKQHGNFGIGTFNELDGELILFGGKCFKATSDSRILPMNDLREVPIRIGVLGSWRVGVLASGELKH